MKFIIEWMRFPWTPTSSIFCPMEPQSEQKRVMPSEDLDGKQFKNASPNF